MKLDWRNHRQDPAAWATELGVSREAVDLYLASEVIDLHIDSFNLTRQWGYDLVKRHRPKFKFPFGQADLPRIREAQVTGGMWSLTTNPFRRAARRPVVFLHNLRRLSKDFIQCNEDYALVRNLAEYKAARAAGKHGVFLVIQGGNALDGPKSLDLIPDDLILRITVVHLTNSTLGATSSPSANHGLDGLTPEGMQYVRQLNRRKIFVDLAHIGRKGFFDAVQAHDKHQPLMVSHTGVSGVFKHWRHLDDDQIRAIAATGGNIGIMYQAPWLGDPTWEGKAETIVRHLEHVVNVGGEDTAALGSDWDGAIITPRDMQTCLELPVLVQRMLDRKWPSGRVQKVLGGNFLRALGALRG